VTRRTSFLLDPTPNITAMTSTDPPALRGGSAAPEDESASWVTALTGTGRAYDAAVTRLHAMLLRVCRAEVNRRRHQLGVSGPELDDLAYQAAADATMAVTAKVTTFRGDSRFTTWAYKFAIFEVSSKMGRHFWKTRATPLDGEHWDRLPDRLGMQPADHAEHKQLIDAVRAAVEQELSERQRTVFLALVVSGVPLDALVAQTGASRNSLYKTMFDARRKIRRHLVANGYLNDSSAIDTAKEGL
jgi:RNA polymerase sigma-70 factor, ECF subfamily